MLPCKQCRTFEGMKKLSADYLFTGNDAPIKNGVVGVAANGEIELVMNPLEEEIDWNEVDQHDGVICPGFINTHCHLELSYLKGKIEKHTQLHGFVEQLMAIRNEVTEQERWMSIQLGEKEMLSEGIVAVGDISNGRTTFHQKGKKNLRYHTFVEVFGLEGEAANEIMQNAVSLKNAYPRSTRISISPHAPYSLSKELLGLLTQESNELITIHNQETEGENELFQSKSGKLYEQLKKFSPAISDWEATGKNSLPSYLKGLNQGQRILLVHNTYTTKEDLIFAKASGANTYWCFCPNANEYIEGRQPEYGLFLNEKCTIGTDSLASNWGLSILDELKTISKKNNYIPLEKLIRWATYNGAEFLGFEKFGSIEVGKTPGLNLIKNVDLENLRLTDQSKITVL